MLTTLILASALQSLDPVLVPDYVISKFLKAVFKTYSLDAQHERNSVEKKPKGLLVCLR